MISYMDFILSSLFYAAKWHFSNFTPHASYAQKLLFNHSNKAFLKQVSL
jgi:hypothetical protein